MGSSSSKSSSSAKESGSSSGKNEAEGGGKAGGGGGSSRRHNEWPIRRVISQLDTQSSDLDLTWTEFKHIISGLELLTSEQVGKLLLFREPVKILVVDHVDHNKRSILKVGEDTRCQRIRLQGLWKSEFVQRLNLQAGDEVGLRCSNGKLEFNVLARTKKAEETEKNNEVV